MRPTEGSQEMSTGGHIQFAKLNGQNYATWAIHMRSVLQSKYLWSLIKGKEICPVAPTRSVDGSPPQAEEVVRVQTLIDKWEATSATLHNTFLHLWELVQVKKVWKADKSASNLH